MAARPLRQTLVISNNQSRGVADQRVSPLKLARLRESGASSDEFYEKVELVFHPVPRTTSQIGNHMEEVTCAKCVFRSRGYSYCCGYLYVVKCREGARNDRKNGYWKRKGKPKKAR